MIIGYKINNKNKKNNIFVCFSALLQVCTASGRGLGMKKEVR